MNPRGRSLEIVAIGLGQAGGNIAAELQRLGYPALAFNTARTDLRSLGASRLGLPDSQRIYIGLEGFDGAGNDTEYGHRCIAAHADTIRDAVKEHAADADVVLLIAGLGGGTGSCLAEFTAVLADLELPIAILTTLPHSHESGIAKVNALRGVCELTRNPVFGWILIDNARLARQHRDASIDTYFETINRQIVEPLDVLNRLNDRDATRAIRTLDGEDVRRLLLSGGVLYYASNTLPKLDVDAVVGSVRSALTDNPMMPAGAELADVASLGLVIEAAERCLAGTPFSLYEEIAHQLKKETGGAAVHVGLYRHADDDDSTTLRVISSSRALPAAIDPMMAEAEREAATIHQKVQQAVPTLDLAKLDALHPLRRPVSRAGSPLPVAERAETDRTVEREPQEKPAAPKRTMAKVTPAPPAAAAQAKVARAAGSVSAPAATKPAPEREATASAPAATPPQEAAAEPGVAKVEAAPMPQASKVEELRRMVTSGPATAAATPTTDPSRDRYEHLAKSFTEAKREKNRRYIARELVAGQRSEDALERFYAVNAMARVDAAYFRDALTDAAKDADSHVADLARRVLAKLSS